MTGVRTRTSLADQVYEQIEQKILSGDCAPGSVLSENRLSAELGVSRTPVREALARLESQGLLQTAPNRGIVVSGVTPEDAADIYEIRLRIEGLAAARCAQRISPEQVRALGEMVELQEFYAGRENAQRLRVLDSDFHQAIFEYCASPTLAAILTDLHHKLQRYRAISLSRPERTVQAVLEHKQIYEAIARGDAPQAQRLTERHVRNAYKNILKYQEKEQSSWGPLRRKSSKTTF